MSTAIAIIVPTLGHREKYLQECLESIQLAGRCHVLLVAPPDFKYQQLVDKGLVNQVEIDPGRGLAAAINFAESKLPEAIKYFNWLGDDDCLTPDSITIASSYFESMNIDFLWGSCIYIDENGSRIGLNRSGSWALYLMRIGPDLIPQPGALFRRQLFREIGGLNEEYKLAFDFDMFIRFQKTGVGFFVPKPLSRYRWHRETLSTGNRSSSIREARQVRMSHLPRLVRLFAPLWEYPISWLTLAAGSLLTYFADHRRRLG